MTRGPRMTLQTQLVLRAMLAEPAAERYGLQLCALTGLASGTIYPIVARLEQLGWVESNWEIPVSTWPGAGRGGGITGSPRRAPSRRAMPSPASTVPGSSLVPVG